MLKLQDLMISPGVNLCVISISYCMHRRSTSRKYPGLKIKGLIIRISNEISKSRNLEIGNLHECLFCKRVGGRQEGI